MDRVSGVFSACRRHLPIRSLDVTPTPPQMLRKYGTFVFGFDAAYGLALLVATGCVRDYPVDLSESARRARPALGGRATGTPFL